MKLKTALEFRYKKNLKVIGVFYLALAVITLLAYITKKLYPYSLDSTEIGDLFYYLTAIFSFFIGILSFKDEQNFFVQNGVTREQCHQSFFGYLPITFGFALAERFFTYLLCLAVKLNYSHFLGARFIIENRAFNVDVVFEALALMCFLSFGYLISIIIRRVKPAYIIVAIIAIVVAMFADYSISDVKGILPISAYVPKLIYFGSAYNEFVPLNFVISHVLTICILLSLSHLLSLGVSVNGKEKH